MKKLKKFDVGQEVPEGSIYLSSIKHDYRDVEHYFLVEEPNKEELEK